MASANKRQSIRSPELLHYANMVGSNDTSVGSKIKTFISRNHKLNAHLYDLPDNLENISFVVCPILGIRTLNIKKRYIEGVLQLSVEEFKERFPNQQLSCKGLSNRIAQGLAVEIAPGVTRHSLSVEKATKTRAEIGEDGLSINDRKGRKTRETHMNKKDENGLNGYQRIAAVARPKQRETRAKMGQVSSSAENDVWLAYRNFVNWLTMPLKSEILDGRPTGRAGTEGAYHVDHIYSTIHGFKNKISPWVIAHRNNLRCVDWKTNVKKNSKSEITIEDLLERTEYSSDISETEYNNFISAWENNPTSSSAILLERYNDITNPELQKKYPL